MSGARGVLVKQLEELHRKCEGYALMAVQRDAMFKPSADYLIALHLAFPELVEALRATWREKDKLESILALEVRQSIAMEQAVIKRDAQVATLTAELRAERAHSKLLDDQLQRTQGYEAGIVGELVAARKALEPFAQEASRWDDIPGSKTHDNVELWQRGNYQTGLNVGHLRNARAALAPTAQEGG